MSSLKQENGQSSPKEMILESGSDSSPLSDGSSPSSPLEVSSSGGSSSDSSGGSSSDSSGGSSSDSSGDSSDSSDESSSDDSSNSSSGSSDQSSGDESSDRSSNSSSGSSDQIIKKKKKAVVQVEEPKSTCLLQRLGTTDYKLGLEVEEPKASKKVYFTKDQCRWTMIKHPVSVNGVRNFVLTANNAFVDVLFEGKVMNVDITLGDDLEEKLRISMKASSERNCVTVAEEYQPLEATRCSVLTEDLVNIGSYDPCSGTYPPNGCFGTTDYKLDLQKTRENDGAVEFVTEGDSLLNFSFGEKDGKDTVHIYFAYGKKECHELGFDFEVSGHDLNVVNLPSALATTATAPPLSSSLTTTTTTTAPSLCSAWTTTTTTTAPLVPLNHLQILHGCTVMAPGITRKVEEEPVKEVSTTTKTCTSLVHCGKSEVIAEEVMPMQKK